MKCCYSERLINKLLILNERAKDKIDMKMVKKAIYFAKKYHGDQKRQSGAPYYSHPIEVAYMISDYLFRTDIIVTSILHDTIEDTALTKEMIVELFGEIIASQVEDLTRIKENGKITSAEMVERLYKEKKKDVLLVKLFDRVHNIQTLGAKSPEKMAKILQETIATFIWLVAFLEIPDIEEEIAVLLQHHYNSIISTSAAADNLKQKSVVNDSHLPSLALQNN